MEENMDFKSIFPATTADEWEQKIETDLKGKDPNKVLFWKTDEGLSVKAYRRAEDIKDLKSKDATAGAYPFIRGNKKEGNAWEIRQDIDIRNLEKANSVAVNAIKNGVKGIGLNTKRVVSPVHFSKLINNIDIEKVNVHFISAYFYPMIVDLFIEELEARGIDKNKVCGSLNFDSLGYYILYGEYYKNAEENFQELSVLFNRIKEKLPRYKIINVNGNNFHNGGANAVQELAFSLSSANEYLAQMTKLGHGVDEVSSRMQFTFGIGSNYFIEIAKLRAARLLWAKIVEQYKPLNVASLQMHIHAVGSSWNKTIYDAHNNILRSTTEAMSAIIGNCDSLSLSAFDNTYKYPDQFSSHISQNIQSILREESYLDKVADPAGGSYYVESLTDQIAEAAWELFQKIEKMGGFIEATNARFFINEIKATCQQRDMNIAQRRKTILGVNQFPKKGERMSEKVGRDIHLKPLGGISPYRGAYAFEKLRLQTEEFAESDDGFTPKVHLLTFGNLAIRKARANFGLNFFGCVGYDVEEAPYMSDLKEAAQAAIASKADIIVLCSSDQEYSTDGVKILNELKNNTSEKSIVVAGYPQDDIEQLKEHGVSDFIHVKTNVLESLSNYNKSFGIN